MVCLMWETTTGSGKDERKREKDWVNEKASEKE